MPRPKEKSRRQERNILMGGIMMAKKPKLDLFERVNFSPLNKNCFKFQFAFLVFEGFFFGGAHCFRKD